MSEHNANIAVQIGSERSFGLVIAAVLAIIGVWPLLFGGGPRWYLLIPAIVLTALAFAAPRTLKHPNRLWFRFGMFLGGIVAPIVMALIYFITFLPIGGALRLFGKDLLQKRLDPAADTYWIARTDPPQSMKKQF